ncbi:MAG: DNA polymerase III subunit delta' [Deltaproteobacteria bacterium]|nr:DNA polymerase III subunit delta' [Deltaproteobacteria bacterium]
MSFLDIYGHEKQIALLKSAITGGRLAHAYLFHGREGIGKKAAAMAFAAAILCDRKQAEACHTCLSCKKTAHGNHPDLITIAAEGAFIKIQAVKDLLHMVAFRPLEGGRRLFIIDEADRMNQAAANALLKTLEEPSPANILVLITSKPYTLPRTILSRCQQIRFSPLRQETVAAYLEKIESLAHETARMIAAAAEGSIQRALQLKRDDYLADRKTVMGHIAADHSGDPLQRLSLMRYLGKDKKDVPEKLSILLSCFRDALVWKELPGDQTPANSDEKDAIQAITRLTTDDILYNLQTISASIRALEYNANKLLTLEAMTFTLRL